MWLVRHGTFQRFEYIEVNTLDEAIEVSYHLKEEGVSSQIIHGTVPNAKIERAKDRLRRPDMSIKFDKFSYLHGKAMESIALLKAYWSGKKR